MVVNTRILRFGSKAQDKGIPETMVCRILLFMWSLGPIIVGWLYWTGIDLSVTLIAYAVLLEYAKCCSHVGTPRQIQLCSHLGALLGFFLIGVT